MIRGTPEENYHQGHAEAIPEARTLSRHSPLYVLFAGTYLVASPLFNNFDSCQK
jgi:hypothetical protein